MGLCPKPRLLFSWMKKVTKKITAYKKLPDNHSIPLKILKLSRYAPSNNKIFYAPFHDYLTGNFLKADHLCEYWDMGELSTNGAKFWFCGPS
jgi:hypothetical protein